MIGPIDSEGHKGTRTWSWLTINLTCSGSGTLDMLSDFSGSFFGRNVNWWWLVRYWREEDMVGAGEALVLNSAVIVAEVFRKNKVGRGFSFICMFEVCFRWYFCFKILVVDVSREEGNSPYKVADGSKFSALYMVKRALTLFVQNKHSIDSRHKFALVMLQDIPIWVRKAKLLSFICPCFVKCSLNILVLSKSFLHACILIKKIKISGLY